MKVGFLIVGRLKSTRLPRKLLLPLGSKSIFEIQVARIREAKGINEILLCTSLNPQDDALVEEAERVGIAVYRGDENDVLERMFRAASARNFDLVVTITGDCPLVAPSYVDEIVSSYGEEQQDLITQFGLPHGCFSYGIDVRALGRVVSIKDSSDTEVWGRYFSDTGNFKVFDLPVSNPFHARPDVRLTLDYPEDYEVLKRLCESLKLDTNPNIPLNDVISFLDANPSIRDLNLGCVNKFRSNIGKAPSPRFKRSYIVKSVLLIGCGSIGRRHISALQAIGITDISALRTYQGTLGEIPKCLEVHEYFDWGDLVGKKFDVAVVSNPTSMHVDTLLKAIPHVTRGIFVEKPLSNSSQSAARLNEKLRDAKLVGFVGCNLLFHPIIRKVTSILESGDLGGVLAFQANVGQWLPDWHPYEDFRSSYFARSDLGGGALLTLCHEVYLSREFCGDSSAVVGISIPDQWFGLDVDVNTSVMVRHSNDSVSQLHMDFVQNPLHREGNLFCENGFVKYDFGSKMVSMANRTNKVTQFDLSDECDRDDMYADQMAEFINLCEQGRLSHKFDFDAALKDLVLIDEAKSSFSSCQFREVVYGF